MAYIGVSPSNGVRRVHTYTATASQTTFSGAGAEGTSLSYKDSNFVDVYQNGIKLGDADYTSTSGTSIVLAQGASVDDLVVVVVFDVFSVADTVSKADGGTFDGNVTMGGTLGVGTASPDGTLHVHSASAGSVTPQTGADDLVVENNTHGGISLLTPDANRSAIVFGHASDNHKMQIRHDGGTSLSQIISDDALTFNVGDGTERMRIDANGHITKPTQSAFLARKNSNLLNFAHGSNITVDYNDEIFDQNADYNNSSYTFTAPVTGKYHLNARVRLTNLDTGAGYYYLGIITSNREYYNILPTQFASDPYYFTGIVSELVDMDASDTAYCVVYQEASGTGGQTDIQGGSTFGGYLVC